MVVVLPRVKATLPSTSQSPAVRLMLVTLALVTLVSEMDEPVATVAVMTSPMLPACALSAPAVPLMPATVAGCNKPGTTVVSADCACWTCPPARTRAVREAMAYRRIDGPMSISNSVVDNARPSGWTTCPVVLGAVAVILPGFAGSRKYRVL